MYAMALCSATFDTTCHSYGRGGRVLDSRCYFGCKWVHSGALQCLFSTEGNLYAKSNRTYRRSKRGHSRPLYVVDWIMFE